MGPHRPHFSGRTAENAGNTGKQVTAGEAPPPLDPGEMGRAEVGAARELFPGEVLLLTTPQDFFSEANRRSLARGNCWQTARQFLASRAKRAAMARAAQ